MKPIFLFVFAIILLTGCGSETYPKIQKDTPFIATVNIKDTSLTFLDKHYKTLAQWDLKIPFTGALLLGDQDTILLYGKDMDSIEVFSLSKGKKIASWEVHKGIVNMKLLHDGKSIVAVNQSLNSVYFLNQKGELEDQIKVGKSPLTILQENQLLYVINFNDTKLSVINLETRKVEKEFPIRSSSTGALLKENQHEIWIGGHGEGANIEDHVYIYSTETGVLKRTVKAPTMPINLIEMDDSIFVLSHGTNSLYKMNMDGKIVKSTTVGVNPFEMLPFSDNLIIAGYDSDELYVIDTDTVEIKKTITVGKGPFQMIRRE